ncbi:MAG: hypothetical protein JSS76_19870 [Bacteroidetes bacterium]|nr:hypothetical protein [Bacteroidota bacterium]
MSIRHSIYSLLCMAAVSLLLSGCGGTDTWKHVDVSSIPVTLHVRRFEQDFYHMDTADLAASEMKMRAKYGAFYDDYVTGIMNFGRPANRLDTAGHDPHIDILAFMRNPADRNLYDSVEKHYADFTDVEKELTGAVKHFKYYFPKQPAPTTIYTFISEFGNGAITYGDTTLGIGLDMYLGRHYIYYESVQFPEFMKRKLSKEYIVPNAMEVLYNLHYDQTAYNAERPLIEAMISEGKKFYFMECMLPDAPDSLLIGYTSAQADWCRKSEGSIWKYFNEKDLLYKVNYMEQKRYTSDGPTTAGMPPESPGRVGGWVGWQIVRRFMKNNRGKVSLEDLMTQYSAKQILAEADYKPK